MCVGFKCVLGSSVCRVQVCWGACVCRVQVCVWCKCVGVHVCVGCMCVSGASVCRIQVCVGESVCRGQKFSGTCKPESSILLRSTHYGSFKLNIFFYLDPTYHPENLPVI